MNRTEQKLKMLFTKDVCDRITFTEKDNKENIQIDLHTLSCKEAERLVKNVIAVASEEFELELIHGYTHGTALKSMINSHKLSDRVSNKYGLAYNPGVTRMTIDAA